MKRTRLTVALIAGLAIVLTIPLPAQTVNFDGS